MMHGQKNIKIGVVLHGDCATFTHR